MHVKMLYRKFRLEQTKYEIKNPKLKSGWFYLHFYLENSLSYQYFVVI